MEPSDFFIPKNPLHDEPEQLKRQKAAARLNVQSIDPKSQTGQINNYTVTLTDCSCRDFIIRRNPCKHMYRLAHELGIFQIAEKVKNDPTIKTHAETLAEKAATVELVKTLSDKEKAVLYEVMYEYIYHHATSCFDAADIPLALFGKNLLCRVDTDVAALAKLMRKDALSLIVRKHNLPIKLNAAKVAILEALQELFPHIFQEIISSKCFVIPSELVMSAPKKIYGLVLQPRDSFFV